jgi:cytoskeletal protein CcmA (bactofilin family)
MEEKNQNNPASLDNSLETPETSVNGQSVAANSADIIKVKTSLWAKIVKKLSFVNIYLLLFIFIVLLAVMITYIGVRNNKKVDDAGKINAQNLSSQAIDSISANNTQIGDPKETLTIASNSVFNGKALFRDSIDVAGTIRVGGALSLPGITVSGSSSFENVTVSNSLAIAGDANVSGNLAVQKSLTVSGGASFGGAISASQLNIDRLTLNQDVLFNRHVKTGGGVPGVSTGSAVGAGGTGSISGSDVAGTVTINVGGSPSSGNLATISFVNSYGSEPHVVITPVGSAAGSLNWYITRSANGFSINTNNAPAASNSFSFDYVVIN